MKLHSRQIIRLQAASLVSLNATWIPVLPNSNNLLISFPNNIICIIQLY